MSAKYDRDWDPQDEFADDFDGTIREARFAYREEYMDGTRLLAILPIIASGTDKPVEAIFSMGDGWVPSADGKFCSHPADPDKIPGKNSLYGKLLVRVGKVLRPELEQHKVDLRERGSSKDARVWEGMRFHWKREVILYKGKAFEEKGGQIEASHLLPTKFLGLETAQAATQAAAATATIDGRIEDKLNSLVASSPDIQTFQIEAMRIPEVVADERLRMMVLDAGTGGYWAKNKQ